MADNEAVSIGAGPVMPDGYQDYRVLVADDEEAITELVQRVVQSRLRCQVVTAASGAEAMQILNNQPLDVFVTDMRMPGLNGIELVRTVKEKHPETSIFVMTGYGNEFPYMAAIQAGADDFINKPFLAAEFEAKLARIFREREILRQRERAESKYRSLFELSADGMLLLDDQSFAILDANVAFRELAGRTAEQVAESRVFDFFDDRDRVRLEHWLGICSRSGKGTMSDLALTRPEDEAVHVDITASFIQAPFQRLVFLTLKDVTEKREVDKRLAEAAQRDELTGLLNKRSFQNRIEGATRRAQRAGTPLCLMLIDLDNFKRCNDTYGHQIGDQLLISVGEAISKSIRASTSDEGFRCGGDEFAVLLHGTEREGCLRVAERIQLEFGKAECYGTTMSIGVGIYNGGTTEAFIRKVDEAMYGAKGAGKNAIEVV